MTDLEGFIGRGAEGYYYHQTRFLSRLRVTLGQAHHEGGVISQVAGLLSGSLGKGASAPPTIVSINAVDAYSTIAYYVAPSPAGAKAGPDPDSGEGGGEIVNHGIELQTNRFLAADGLHLAITVTNHALAPTRVALCWDMDSDFADQTEAEQGERKQTASVERRWHPRLGGGQLLLQYQHPKLQHGAAINFSGPGHLLEKNNIVSWELSLEPQRPVTLALDLYPVFCGERVKAEDRPIALGKPPSVTAPEVRLELHATNNQVQRAWDRAVSDLASLALLEGEGEERLAPAGGVPKYLGLFGRDALMTSFQASFLAPAMLRGSLALLAKWNATKYDDRFDEEPGRVLHQRQLSPLALLEKNPFLHYYGDYSAPGLFLIDQAWHLALTGDKAFFLSMRDRILQTLEWMDRDGDRDGDGFYEYATKAGSWGEKKPRLEGFARGNPVRGRRAGRGSDRGGRDPRLLLCSQATERARFPVGRGGAAGRSATRRRRAAQASVQRNLLDARARLFRARSRSREKARPDDNREPRTMPCLRHCR
ncbi:MAG: hypothetical protein JO212_15135 [Acetobacteraceae bacterium]|nr:hypothetical protein [Acetobacteraceae bacterium]